MPDEDRQRCQHSLHLDVTYDGQTHVDVDIELPLPAMLEAVALAEDTLRDVRRDIIAAGALRN